MIGPIITNGLIKLIGLMYKAFGPFLVTAFAFGRFVGLLLCFPNAQLLPAKENLITAHLRREAWLSICQGAWEISIR